MRAASNLNSSPKGQSIWREGQGDKVTALEAMRGHSTLWPLNVSQLFSGNRGTLLKRNETTQLHQRNTFLR